MATSKKTACGYVRWRLTATVSHFSSHRNSYSKRMIPSVVLKDVSYKGEKIVSYKEFELHKAFQKADVRVGDQIEFDATVRKGMFDSIGLSHPFNVKVIFRPNNLIGGVTP